MITRKCQVFAFQARGMPVTFRGKHGRTMTTPAEPVTSGIKHRTVSLSQD